MIRCLILCSIAAVALAASPTESAATPSRPTTSATTPSIIYLVGEKAGVPDPAGLFTVSTGIPLALVEVDFSACPDLCPAAVQYLGQTSNCANKKVSKIADLAGSVTMDIVGAAVNQLPNSGSCATIWINGVFEASVRVAAYDLDGIGGLNVADLNRWIDDFFSLTNPSRSDYFTPFANVSAVDLSVWLDVYFCGNSVESGTSCCVGSPVAHVPAGQLNLAWDECVGGGGLATKIFACNSNTGGAALTASVLAPSGATSIVGMDGTINFISAAVGGVPNWWRFNSLATGTCTQIAGCRTTSLSASANFTSGPFGCLDPWSGNAFVGMNVEYSTGGPQYGRINVSAAVADPMDLSSGSETYAFQVKVNYAKTTGAGACVGCLETMCFFLNSIHLFQTNSADVLTTIYDVTTPQATNTAFWQGSAAVCATPVKNVTWGRIKTLYK